MLAIGKESTSGANGHEKVNIQGVPGRTLISSATGAKLTYILLQGAKLGKHKLNNHKSNNTRDNNIINHQHMNEL